MIRFPHRRALMESLPKGSVGAEIGVLRGQFSRVILDTARPRLLYLVDCWTQQLKYRMGQKTHDDHMHTCMKAMAPEIARGIVRPLALFSADAADLIPTYLLDWVYIDADHSYEGCLADLRAWYPKIKYGGVIAGHDYIKDKPFVSNAVSEFMEEAGLTDLGLTTQRVPSFYLEKR